MAPEPANSDYYALLGVSRNATPAEIKAAWRKRARDLHPDINPDDAQVDRFKAVAEAYEVLSDPALRARYDRTGARPDGAVWGATSVTASSGLADVARAVARGVRRATQRRAEDIEIDVHVRVAEMVSGTRRVLELPRRGAHGAIEARRLEFVLPPLLRPGQRLRWPGEGNPGSVAEQEPGDLWLTARLSPGEPWVLERDGLVGALPLLPSVWLGGGVVGVPTPDGPLDLAVPPRLPAGHRLRIDGRGVPQADGSRGPLIFVVDVEFPIHADPNALAALRAWEAGFAPGSFPHVDALAKRAAGHGAG